MPSLPYSNRVAHQFLPFGGGIAAGAITALKHHPFMNFFQRRKLFKKANFLDLRPVRLLGHQLRDDGKISLLMPRFKNRVNSALFQPNSKGQFINIKLDRFGGHTWLLIDGESNVAQICSGLNEQFPEELQPLDETEVRVTNFLAMLYQERYITFREIQDK